MACKAEPGMSTVHTASGERGVGGCAAGFGGSAATGGQGFGAAANQGGGFAAFASSAGKKLFISLQTALVHVRTLCGRPQEK